MRLGFEVDQVAFPCIKTPQRPLYVITECHQDDMNDYAKLYAQFPSSSTVLTKWCGHLWNASKWEEMEGIGFLLKWQTHPRTRTLPFDQSHEAETFTLNEPALWSMDLYPAVTRERFEFILTGCDTANLGSLGFGWNRAWHLLSWETVKDGGKAAPEVPSGWCGAPGWSVGKVSSLGSGHHLTVCGF